MRVISAVITALFLLLASGLTMASEDATAPLSPARTYLLSTISVIRTEPGGTISYIWNENTLFTGRESGDDWIRISGFFPDDKWQPLPSPLWVSKHYAREISPERPKVRQGPPRYIVIDKNDFSLKVVEQKESEETVLYETQVALGLDGCKPQEKGGRCYYTEAGEYAVRWKIHDPKGIEWCIPESMESEYPNDIANGERCFRGPLGNYALNIGKTYAIHGTNRPDLLGKKVSHGCVRVANADMREIYRLMDVGDKVVIVESHSAELDNN